MRRPLGRGTGPFVDLELDAMSMPAVGSSNTSTRASTPSQRPIMTFCWLPPDSVLTGTSIVAVFTFARGTSPTAPANLSRRHDRRRAGGLAAEHDVVGNRLVEEQALTLAVGGRKATPFDTAWRRERDDVGRPTDVDGDRAAVLAGSGEHPCELRHTGADAAGDGNDLSLTDGEGHIARRVVETFETSTAGSADADGELDERTLMDPSPEHRGHDGLGRELARRPLRSHDAVAHHRDIVGDAEHLVEVVRDEQHPTPADRIWPITANSGSTSAC